VIDGCLRSRDVHASLAPNREFPAIDYRGVTGIVTVWGEIEIDREGVRAEHARIEALTLYSRQSNRQKRSVWEIADDLDVDLFDLDEIEDVAGRYGDRLPEALRGASARRRRMKYSPTPIRSTNAPITTGP
jgi:hypothetical protein